MLFSMPRQDLEKIGTNTTYLKDFILNIYGSIKFMVFKSLSLDFCKPQHSIFSHLRKRQQWLQVSLAVKTVE